VKPIKHCGAMPLVDNYKDGRFYVMCLKCGHMVEGDTVEEAVIKWNSSI